MGTTYVYATTRVHDKVQISLADTGPAGTGAKLIRSSIGPQESNAQIASIPRSQSSLELHTLDIAFTTDGWYVGSLAVLLRGHGLGSMIWWRWRADQLVAGAWISDYQSHGTTVTHGGVNYSFRVTGKSTIGYDDIAVEIARQ